MHKAAIQNTHLDQMRDIVGPSYVLEETDPTSPYLRDWSGDYVSAAMCVVLPGSTQQVSEIMQYCAQNGLVVVPQGGNTGLVGGCFIENGALGVLLNLKRMNAIRSFDAENYTATVEAGCIVQTLQDHAKDHNRLFPLSFGAEGSAQIGGAIATNAGGLNVLRYGMTRNMVLGLEVVLPDGTILNRLSHLRKDNSGLDLKQLFIGTEGSLGVITAASLQLVPAPKASETAFLALEGHDDVVTLFNVAREHCADLLNAFELIPRTCVDLALEHQDSLRDPLQTPYPVYILMELSCSGPLDLRGLFESFLETVMEAGLVVDGAIAESLTQAENFWAIREAMVEAQAAKGRHLRTDISVPVSRVPDFIHKAQDALHAHQPDWTAMAYGHIGDGNIHLNAMPPASASDEEIRTTIPSLLTVIYDVVDGLEGSISAEHGIGRSRLQPHEDRQSACQRLINKKIKTALDPQTVMNPGCLISTSQKGPVQ